MQFCAHQQNPATCLTCFREKQSTQPRYVERGQQQAAQNAPKPPSHTEGVVPLGEALLRSTQGAEARARLREQQLALQGKDATGATQNVPMPHSAADEAPRFKEIEGFVAEKPGEKVWIPPKRKGLMDKLPKHPHLGEGKAVFSGPPVGSTKS